MQIIKTYKNFLSKEECDFIINNHKLNLEKAKIGESGVINESIRKANTNTIQIQNDIFQKLNNIIDDSISEMQNIVLEKINQFKFIEYPTGGYYKWHKDSSPNTEFASRLLSVVIQLNDNYEGGELLYKTPKGEFVFEKGLGNLHIFSSSIWHSVTEVTSGQRYSIVNWYCIKPNNIDKKTISLI